MMTYYVIEERVVTPSGKNLWHREPSGERFATGDDAEDAIEDLEERNDDGAPMEYRVVEA